MAGQEISYFDAWSAWADGIDIRQRVLWGLEIYWWARASKIATLVAGFVVILDIIGAERVEEWVNKRQERASTRHNIRRKLDRRRVELHAYYQLHGRTRNSPSLAKAKAKRIAKRELRKDEIRLIRRSPGIATRLLAMLLAASLILWYMEVAFNIFGGTPASGTPRNQADIPTSGGEEIFILVKFLILTLALIGMWRLPHLFSWLSDHLQKPLIRYMNNPNQVTAAIRICSLLTLIAAFHFDILAT